MVKYFNNMNDCGATGKNAEANIKAYLNLKICVSSAGKTDMRKANACYEIKTGAGELGNLGEKLVKGSSKVIYIPVVNESLPINKQEGFVMARDLFLSILEQTGMLREKTSTAGVRKVTIQTFWNKKLNKPHGKGLERMLDAFYSSEEVETFEEWLAQF